MDDRLKQRLVGAAVIVALAAIFIPMILEGPADDMGPVGSNLPSEPDYAVKDRIEPLVLPPPPPSRGGDGQVVLEQGEDAPAAPESSETASPEQPVAPPEPVAPADEALPETETAPAGEPARAAGEAEPEVSGWVVQVGSFSKKSNALGLRDKLRNQGYSTFVEQADTGDGVTYRVRVGPQLQRSNAEDQRQAIEENLGLKGIVTAYP